LVLKYEKETMESWQAESHGPSVEPAARYVGTSWAGTETSRAQRGLVGGTKQTSTRAPGDDTRGVLRSLDTPRVANRGDTAAQPLELIGRGRHCEQKDATRIGPVRTHVVGEGAAMGPELLGCRVPVAHALARHTQASRAQQKMGRRDLLRVIGSCAGCRCRAQREPHQRASVEREVYDSRSWLGARDC
jgi:hypothetical protein